MSTRGSEEMAAAAPVTVAETTKRKINLSLSEKAFADLQELVRETSRNMSDIIRFGLSLAKLYFAETKKGHSWFVGTSDGKAIMKIVYPS